MTSIDNSALATVDSVDEITVRPSDPRTPMPSLAGLPPSGTKRWVIKRKAAVVAAVRSGLLTLDEACQRYHLSVEEFLSWQRLIDRHGVRALRATRLQDYRPSRGLLPAG